VKCLICSADESEFVTTVGQWRFERCRNCTVLFTAPLSEQEVVSHYTSGALLEGPGEKSPIPPSELLFPPWKHREHAHLLNRLAALGTDHGRLLDVGCLWGSFLNQAHKSGFDVVGIEPFGKAATYVKDVLNLNASQGTLRSAQFPPDSFDVVTILDVIEHLTDPVAELKEAHRVVKPGGLLAVSTPNVGSLIPTVVNTERRLLGRQWFPFDNPPWHLWGFTKRSIKTCCESAGFAIESVDPLDSSLKTTNLDAGSTHWKKKAFQSVGAVSDMLGFSDRMAVFARKAAQK
jgi:2-polyprenyl-3-methyl-5-hydroxy-6-metoxy-1,4-benzoquinol methylase